MSFLIQYFLNLNKSICMSEQIRRIVPRQYYSTHQQVIFHCSSDISFKTSFGNCVLKALIYRQWRQTQISGWNLQWSEKERVNDVFEEGLSSSQRVNHFRLYTQLCRKDMMIKNIKKHKRELQKQRMLKEDEWDFLPLTFFLPSEYIMFAQDFKKKGGLWIMKPTSKCQGQGIFLIDKLSQVAPYRHKVNPNTLSNVTTSPVALKPPVPSQRIKKDQKTVDNDKQSEEDEESEKEDVEHQPTESYIIQQYISQPLLFGSKKFDLRIYALCTNYSQLTTWLYRSGFARFTHEPYNTENIDNLESHLTNVEIQKHSDNYDEKRGGKWILDKFKHYLFSRFEVDKVDFCFTQIKNIIIRSLESVQKSILPSKNSFQLYGYDFMIDSNLKPWLIEINGGPSMTANTQFDCKLKCGLIDDVLTIVDLEGILLGNQMTVGAFDLIIDKGIKIAQCKQAQYTSMLGCRNQRKKVLRQIAKDFMTSKLKKEELKDRQQLNLKKKIAPKSEQQKKDKLLPSFYYKRKIQDTVEDSKSQLLEDLRILEKNSKLQEQADKFIPINIC